MLFISCQKLFSFFTCLHFFPVFLIIFKGLSVVRNCLRPEKGPLNHLFRSHLSKAKRQKKLQEGILNDVTFCAVVKCKVLKDAVGFAMALLYAFIKFRK